MVRQTELNRIEEIVFLGRKSLDFKEQVEEGMVEAGLFVDTVFWYQSPEDLEPALSDG